MELHFGAVMIWESFIYNGVRYMKNSVTTAVNMQTHNQEVFQVTDIVRKA